mmetsp:Transcript_28391/g.68198  ORF Transcript_28391/g.68198 Transcript_28391/m.68198 type:complete len:402 (+) Transcript_28391:102-1307(+)
MRVLAALVAIVVATLRRKHQRQLTVEEWPDEFLFISSPAEKKVVWVPLKDYVGSRNAQPLIDAGLNNPRGIAVDGDRGILYIADEGAGKVLRYKLRIVNGEPRVMASQSVVLQDVSPTWLTVAKDGSLFVTDKLTASIVHLDACTLRQLEHEEIEAASLVIQSEMEADAARRAEEAKKSQPQPEENPLNPPSPPQEPNGTFIASVYSRDVQSDLLQSPSGLATDTANLYFSNAAGGTTIGSVIRAAAVKTADTPSPEAIASNTDTVVGVAAAPAGIFYTTSAKNVYAVRRVGGPPVTIADTLESPQGIVWNNDNTIFVADSTANTVFSFPAILEPGTLRRATELHDATGLAVLTKLSSPWIVENAVTGEFGLSSMVNKEFECGAGFGGQTYFARFLEYWRR